ncbi:MAG: glucose-6-phosphate isomerase [Micavibrio sp.]
MALRDSPSFQALRQHHQMMSDFDLGRALHDKERCQALMIDCHGLMFDFSKNLVSSQTIHMLMDMARSCHVEEWRTKLFRGEKINNGENRPVLHPALRADPAADVRVDGVAIIPEMQAALKKAYALSEAIRQGKLRSPCGKVYTDVLCIGIGGSDLGPRFVSQALRHHHDGPRLHFLSNVDGHAAAYTLLPLDAESTLVVVTSKSFSTQETLMNASLACQWLEQGGVRKEQVAAHIVAVTAKPDKAKEWGVPEDQILVFDEGVGGRYSLWSVAGFPIMLAMGSEIFGALLNGGRLMDQHFRTAPLEKNIPVLMGMIGIWYRNIYDYRNLALLPYDDRLSSLSRYVQQMDMESNGKSVDRDGHGISHATGPIVFGEAGTDCQHSFMQLLHQGEIVPADFIAVAEADHGYQENHKVLLAHCLAQTRALAIGQTREQAAGDPARVFSGQRPSTTIMLPRLDAFSLGMLIAAYEHKVFVQGVVWGLNSFDQPGVELGKTLAQRLLDADEVNEDLFDISTAALWKKARG